MRRLIVVLVLTLCAQGAAFAGSDVDPVCAAYRRHWNNERRAGDLAAMARATNAIPTACPALKSEAQGLLGAARRRAGERDKSAEAALTREHAAAAAEAERDQAQREKAARDQAAATAAADDADYDSARKADTIAGFDAYIAAHPAGRHLAEAQASRQSPEFLKAGDIALEQGDNDTAIRLITQALDFGTLAPRDLQRAYSSRGVAYAAEAQKVLALSDLYQALRLDPNDQRARERRDKLLPHRIAELGLNQLPSRPSLQAVATLTLPASFCSETQRNTFHERQYVPANDAAFQNNQATKKYLDELNLLNADYDEISSSFVVRIVAEAKDYQSIAKDANAKSTEYHNLFDAIMRVPITGTCKN